MSQEKKRPLQLVKDWWGIIVIAVGVLGGYWWLERNFARVEKLAAEKCSLSYEIRLTKADIEFKNTDEEIDLQRTEYEGLLQLATPPQKRVEFKKRFIESLEERVQNINRRISCLRRAKDMCFQGEVTTDKCYDQAPEN